MHHFSNWIGACSAAVLHQSSCFSVHRSSGWSVRAPAELPSLPVSASFSLRDSWLSTRLCQVFGEHSTLSVSFVSEKPSTVECTLTLELPSGQPHVSVHISEDITLFHILYHIMCKNACFPNLCFFHTAIDIRTFIVFFWGTKKGLTAWCINTFTEFFGSSEQNWQLYWL